MHDLKWSEREKKVARQVFDAALQQELVEVLAKFKEMAAHAEKTEDIWSIEEWLGQQRRNIETKYDFRYSQLIMLFGRLMREGRITEQQLEGIAEEKLAFIERIATL